MFRRGFLGTLLGGAAGLLSWASGLRWAFERVSGLPWGKLAGPRVINYGVFADMSGRRPYFDHRDLPHISYRGSAWVARPEFVNEIELPPLETGYQRVSVAFHPLTGRPVPKPVPYDDESDVSFSARMAVWVEATTGPKNITWHVHDASDAAVEAERAGLVSGAAMWAQSDRYLA